MAREKHNPNEVQFIDPDTDEWLGRDVDFSTLIWRQLDRIMKAGTYNCDAVYTNGVMELHQVLQPYHSPWYTTEYDKLKKQLDEAISKIHPNQRNTLMPKLEKRFAFLLFGNQIVLMTNCGILPVKALI